MTCKLIIDTDPGIDDAMAIFYAAAAPDIELLGLTTVFGNVTTEIATRNALRLVEAAGLDVPVAAGAGGPWNTWPFSPSSNVHGIEGFGDIPAATPKGRALAETAAQYLCRVVREQPGEITICAIGPLTNIADALALDPEFASNVARVVIMGGSLEEGGNITPFAEANIWHDPAAAQAVFAADMPRVMVGLDVTHRILCTPADFETIADNAPHLGGMLQEMSRFYLEFYQSVGKFDGCSLHDPAAVIACTHPDLFTCRNVPIDVVQSGKKVGATITAAGASAETVVCMQVVADAVKTLFLSRLADLP